MEDIQIYLQQHEALKAKGLRLTDWDIMEWIGIMDALWDIMVELSSESEENEEQVDSLYDNEILLLKEEWWMTEIQIKAKAKAKYYDERIKIIKGKKIVRKISQKLKVIDHYINQAKRVVK